MLYNSVCKGFSCCFRWNRGKHLPWFPLWALLDVISYTCPSQTAACDICNRCNLWKEPSLFWHEFAKQIYTFSIPLSMRSLRTSSIYSWYGWLIHWHSLTQNVTTIQVMNLEVPSGAHAVFVFWFYRQIEFFQMVSPSRSCFMRSTYKSFSRCQRRSKKQAGSFKRQGCSIDATWMNYWWNIDDFDANINDHQCF